MKLYRQLKGVALKQTFSAFPKGNFTPYWTKLRPKLPSLSF